MRTVSRTREVDPAGTANHATRVASALSCAGRRAAGVPAPIQVGVSGLGTATVSDVRAAVCRRRPNRARLDACSPRARSTRLTALQ